MKNLFSLLAAPTLQIFSSKKIKIESIQNGKDALNLARNH